MAKGFNLTAEINLRGPSNIRQVVGGIRKQLQGVNTSLNININKKNIQGISQANSRLAAINKTLQTTTKNASSATAAFNKLSTSMRNVANVKIPNNISSGMTSATKSIQTSTKAVQQAKNEFEEFGKLGGLAIKRFAAFSVVTGAIYSVNNAIASGVKEFLEYDRQLTRVTQVLNTNRESLKGLDSTITGLSTSLGVSSAELANVTVTLSQAGIQASDTRKALEALAKSALAPTFTSLTNTTEGAIAAMRQFSITAGQLEGALGSINAVAGSFAVEAGDIITAIQRTGGVFASASKGVSQGTDALNEFIAVFTSVRATSRESAETIATGLRTIFTRLQRQDTIESLKAFGVTLTDLEGKFVGPYKAIQLLSEGLRSLDTRDLRFAGIAEELGGFRQIGKVLPLIQQFGTAQNALNVAQQGSTSLARDAAKGQLALSVQIQKVREEFTALVRSISDSTGFRNLLSLGLDLATVFVRVADSIKGLLPLIAGLGAVKGLSALTGFTKGFGGVFKKADGGYIHKFARGGVVPGTGSGDTVPAMLQPGEFVVRKKAVESIGTQRLHKMNKFAKGGRVGRVKNLGAHDGDSWNVIYEPADDPVGSITTRAVGYDAYELSGGKQWENKLGAIATKMAGNAYKKNQRLVGSGSFLQTFQGDKVRGKQSVGSRPKHEVSKKLVDSMVEAGVANRVTKGNNATGSTKKPSVKQIATLKANGFNYNPETGRTKKINKKNSKALGGYIQAFASGGRVGDTVPAMLTPGEFVINKKSASQIGSRALHSLNRADKIQGYNRGGVVGFKNGGGVPARPGTTMGTIGITQADVSMLDEIGNAIKELGISSSSSADLVAQGSQVSYEAAMGALEADKMRADAIGANTDAIDASIKSLQNQGKKVLKVSQALAGSSGGDLEKLSGRLNRGQDADKASKSLRTKEGGALNNLIRSGQADAASIKQYIAGARRDRKTLNEMDSRYVNQRKRQLLALGSSDEEASKLAEQEVRLRRKAVDDNAKSIGAKGPGDFGRRLGDLASKSGFAIAALGSFAGSINEASNANQAAMNAAISGGSTAFGAGQIATGAIVDLLPTDALKNLGGIAGTAASAVFALGQAFISSQNAVRKFEIDKAFKDSEQATGRVNDSLDKLAKDVNNTALIQQIERDIVKAGDGLIRGIERQSQTAKMSFANFFEIMSKGDADPVAVARSQILEAQGFFAYLRSGFDTLFRDESAADIRKQNIGQQVRQFKVVADSVSQLIESRVNSGDSEGDIINDANFKSMARNFALADQATQNLIESIRSNTAFTDSEKQSRIASIVAMNGEALARKQIAIAQRQKEIDALQKSTSVYTRSLERIFTNMEQSINATAAALSKMDSALQLNIASLQGQARIGDVVLDAITVLQNPRTAGIAATNQANASVSGAFGGRDGAMVSSLLNMGENLEREVTSAFNSLLASGTTDAGLIRSSLQSVVRDTLSAGALPADLAAKLSNEVAVFLDKNIKSGETLDFNLLSEKLGNLAGVVESSTKAREIAIKALEFFNKALNTYTTNINKVIDLEISSRNYARKSVEILADSQMDLSKALGKTISVLDVINNFEGRIERLTGGLSSPKDIFNQINDLDARRRAQQATVDSGAQIAAREPRQFIKFNNSLRQTNIQLNESITALKELASNGDIAAAALSKIQEVQQRNAQQIGFFEKALTSSPDQLQEMNESFTRLSRNLNGQTNSIEQSAGAQKAYFEALRSGANGFKAMKAAQTAFAKERGQTLGLLKDILPFLGDGAQAGGVRATVLESMFRESGMGVSPIMQQILNTLRNPATDPAAVAAAKQYDQANTDRSEANRLLGLLESNLATETARLNESAFKSALQNTTVTFENARLDDIASGVSTIVGLMDGSGALGLSSGGIVYAAGGQEIFKPKGTDTVPAMLTPGEFVVNKKATQSNLPLLKSINTGYYAGGGIVSNFKGAPPKEIDSHLKNFVSVNEFLSKAAILEFMSKEDGNFHTAGNMYATMPILNQQLPPSNFDDGGHTVPTGANSMNTNPQFYRHLINQGSYDATKLNNDGENIIGVLPYIDTTPTIYPNHEIGPNKLNSRNLTHRLQREFMTNNFQRYNFPIFDNMSKRGDYQKINSQEALDYNTEVQKVLGHLTANGFMNVTDLDPTNFDTVANQQKVTNRVNEVTPNKTIGAKKLGLIDTQGGMNVATHVEKLPALNKAYIPYDDITTFGRMGKKDHLLNTVANSTPNYSKPPFSSHTFKEKDPSYLKLRDDKLKTGTDIEDISKSHNQSVADILKLIGGGAEWDVDPRNWDPNTGLPMGMNVTGDNVPNPLYNKLFELYKKRAELALLSNKDVSQLDHYVGTMIPGRNKAPLTIVGRNSVFERELVAKAKQIKALKDAGANIPGAFKDATFGIDAAKIAATPDQIVNERFLMGQGLNALNYENYNWVAGINPADLGKKFEEEMEEASNATTDGPNTITRTNLKDIKGDIRFGAGRGIKTLDFKTQYDKYVGKFFDPMTNTFGANIRGFLPVQDNVATIFKNIDPNDLEEIAYKKEVQQGDFKKVKGFNGLHTEQYYNSLLDDNPDAVLERRIKKGTLEGKPTWLKLNAGYPVRRFVGDGPTGSQQYKVGDQIVEQLQEKAKEEMFGPAKIQEGSFGLQKDKNLEDEFLPDVTKKLVTASQEIFSTKQFVRGLSAFIARNIGGLGIRNQNIDNKDKAMRAGGIASRVFNQVGATASNVFDRTPINQAQFVKDAFILASGATQAFGGIASGDTKLLRDFSDVRVAGASGVNKTSAEGLFRSLGGGQALDAVLNYDLPAEYKKFFENDLNSGGKIGIVGSNGQLTYKNMEKVLSDKTDLGGLISLIFNPYNEFPEKSNRFDLMTMFQRDLGNLKGGRGLPFFSGDQMEFINFGIEKLKEYYSGKNPWLGLDFLHDQKNNPATTMVERAQQLVNNFPLGDFPTYDRVNAGFGLNNRFGPLPRQRWISNRGRRGSGQPQNFATGGTVYASAGQAINFQPSGTDTVPAMLTPGEFVINRKSTKENLPLLKAINSRNYATGGVVDDTVNVTDTRSLNAEMNGLVQNLKRYTSSSRGYDKLVHFANKGLGIRSAGVGLSDREKAAGATATYRKNSGGGDIRFLNERMNGASVRHEYAHAFARREHDGMLTSFVDAELLNEVKNSNYKQAADTRYTTDDFRKQPAELFAVLASIKGGIGSQSKKFLRNSMKALGYQQGGLIEVDGTNKYIKNVTPGDADRKVGVSKGSGGGPALQTVPENFSFDDIQRDIDARRGLKPQKPVQTRPGPTRPQSQTIQQLPPQSQAIQQLPQIQTLPTEQPKPKVQTLPKIQKPILQTLPQIPTPPKPTRPQVTAPPSSRVNRLPIPGSGTGRGGSGSGSVPGMSAQDISDMLTPGGRGGDAARGTGTGNDDILGPGGLFPEQYRLKKPSSFEKSGKGWLDAFLMGAAQAAIPSMMAMGASAAAMAGIGLMAATAPVSLPLSALMLGGGLLVGAGSALTTKFAQDWAIETVDPHFFKYLKQLEADHPIATALGAGTASLGTGGGMAAIGTGGNPFAGELSRRLVGGGLETLIGYITGAFTKTAVGAYQGEIPSAGEAFKPDIINMVVDFMSGFLMPGVASSMSRPRGSTKRPGQVNLKDYAKQQALEESFHKALPDLEKRGYETALKIYNDKPQSVKIAEPPPLPPVKNPPFDPKQRINREMDFPELTTFMGGNRTDPTLNTPIGQFAKELAAQTQERSGGNLNSMIARIPYLNRVIPGTPTRLSIGNIDPKTGLQMQRPFGSYNPGRKGPDGEVPGSMKLTDKTFGPEYGPDDALPMTHVHELFHALHAEFDRIAGRVSLYYGNTTSPDMNLLRYIDSPDGQSAVAFIKSLKGDIQGNYFDFGQKGPNGERIIPEQYLRQAAEQNYSRETAATLASSELITMLGENSRHFETDGNLHAHQDAYMKHLRNVIKHLGGQFTMDAIPFQTNAPVDFKARGGMIYASEGQMIDFAPKGTDTVPAMLTPGEFVVNRKATQKNLPLLHSINSGTQYLDEGGEVEDPFGFPETGMTYKQQQERKRKNARERRQQLKRQSALRKLGIGTMGMRAVFEMVTAPNTFDKFSEEAIVQDGDYAQQTYNNIKKRTEEQISDDHKKDYLLSKGKDLTNRFRYLARITNNSKLLLKRAGARLDKPIPPEVDLRGVGRGFTIKAILEQQVASGMAEGNSIKKIDESLRKKYARFVPEAGINPSVASGTGTPSPVYASRGMMIPRGTDTVPAMLTPGEFIVNRQSAQANMPLLNSINNGTQYLHDGGVAGRSGANFEAFSNVLKNVTDSLNLFNAALIQGSAGNAGGEAGGVNTNGIAAFTQNFGNFIEQLQAITFPEVINVQGTVTANVNVAGGDAFANLATESIQSIVQRQVNKALNKRRRDNEEPQDD